MHHAHDRVKETTTSTGTGNITLLGAVSQFQNFSQHYVAGVDSFEYAIVGQTGTEWETGHGYLSTTNTLVREQVYESSNADQLVNFSAGTKDVFVTITAHHINRAPSIGQSIAIATGMAMP